MKRKLDITNCSDDTAKLMPVVNFNNCGGKEDCVEVLYLLHLRRH